VRSAGADHSDAAILCALQQSLRTETLTQLLADKGSAGEHYIQVSSACAILNDTMAFCCNAFNILLLLLTLVLLLQAACVTDHAVAVAHIFTCYVAYAVGLSCFDTLYNVCSLQVLCFMKAGVAVH
jgi:hypothetical protein